MRVGLYPGTFDPITAGHIDIMRRSMALVDKLYVGVAINRNKAPLFDLDERVAMIERECGILRQGSDVQVIVHPFETLLVDCARDVGATLLVRGLRAISDFEFEYQMVGMNRALDPAIETVFLMADSEYQAIASRLVKEVARLGGDVSRFVPSHVVEALKIKFQTQ